MIHRRALLRFTLVAAAATVSLVSTVGAVELDPAIVSFVTPEQFKWRDPTNQAPTNSVRLVGDSSKPELFININKFKPNRMGNPHHHPNERFIMVIDGAPLRGTGTVVDPAHATRVPKGTFMIDHVGKVHWDGTKEESGAYLIMGIGPATQTEVPKAPGPWAGGDPSAVTIVPPDQVRWQDRGGHRTATLGGDPDKRGLFAQLLHLPKGLGFSPPHAHPGVLYTYVLSGTWWVGAGTNFDPANLTVPMKPGTFVTHFGNRMHWDGAKDEDVTLLIIGEGPVTTVLADQVK